MADDSRSEIITLHPKTSTEKEAELERHLREDPKNLHVKKTLAFAFYTNQKYQRAMELYYQLAVEALDDPAVHFYMGNTLFRMQNSRLAIAAWLKAKEKDAKGLYSERAAERIRMAEAFMQQS